MYDDNFLIGKSDINQQHYDVLIFASRNTITANIPHFIEIIAPYAFYNCKNLHQVIFSEHSKLRSIEKEAFSHSSIQNISIPPHLTKIGEGAFSYSTIKQMIVTIDSELRTIEKNSFFFSSLQSFSIPPSLIVLKDGWCVGLIFIEKIYSFGKKSKIFIIWQTLHH